MGVCVLVVGVVRGNAVLYVHHKVLISTNDNTTSGILSLFPFSIYHVPCNEICVIAVMGSIKMKMRLSQGSKENKVGKNSSV